MTKKKKVRKVLSVAFFGDHSVRDLAQLLQTSRHDVVASTREHRGGLNLSHEFLAFGDGGHPFCGEGGMTEEEKFVESREIEVV